MAEVPRGRALFGRFLTSFGFIWLLWAFFGELVAVEFGVTPIDLPLLPGFVFLFLGRALSRGARRPAGPEPQESPQPQTRRPAPLQAEPRPSMPRARFEEPEPIELEETVAIEKIVAEAIEGEVDRIAEEAGTRKTSAEMVAEARERFGRRSG